MHSTSTSNHNTGSNDPMYQAAEYAIQSYYLSSKQSVRTVAQQTSSSSSSSLQQRHGPSTVTTTTGTTGSNTSIKKCAIYSIDIYNHLFVTGGGDGTIKIWNINALFYNNTNNNKKKNQTNQTNHRKGIAHYDEISGRYVSSSESSNSTGTGTGTAINDDDDENDISEEDSSNDNQRNNNSFKSATKTSLQQLLLQPILPLLTVNWYMI
jgi:hypothetical protein